MTASYLLGVAASFGTVLFVIELLRRGILREKYAVLWLAVSAGLLLFALFPNLLTSLATALGFQVPANLLFLLSAVLLLLVSVQLSYEISRVESRTRRLAEEFALLRNEVEKLRREE
ncbi:MAG TPA: DUF2304 domain-containing protein [Actinomycetota bacterium]|nr:DUF2304 domain-containing protein [Actinomycetota bacterium]